MNSWTYQDDGPDAWTTKAKPFLTSDAYKWYHSTLGSLHGSSFPFWVGVAADEGHQEATVLSVTTDPSQKKTNNRTHVSLLVLFSVTHEGVTYPTGTADPALLTQSQVMNLVKMNGKWLMSWTGSQDSATAHYGKQKLKPM